MLNDEQPLSEMSTTDLQRQWRSNPMMRRYSGHSFKRGAFRHLINRIVRDSLPIQPHELSVLLKHQLTYDLLSGQDIRYDANNVNLARLLGTQRLTRLL